MVTEEKANASTGSDLSRESVELAPGFSIDTKIKMGALWHLEDKYDCPFEKMIDRLKSMKIRDIANFIVALALQHNPDMTEQEAVKKFKQLDQTQIEKAVKSLGGIFVVKNSQGAGPILEQSATQEAKPAKPE